MKKTLKATDIKRYSQDDLLHESSKTDYKRLHKIAEKNDDPDNPPTDETFWVNAQIVDPGKKKMISLRLDPDVLDWFKHHNGRYQTLINQVLRQYMNAHQGQ